jgi:hypothetical protein
MVYGDSLLAIS